MASAAGRGKKTTVLNHLPKTSLAIQILADAANLTGLDLILEARVAAVSQFNIYSALLWDVQGKADTVLLLRGYFAW